MSENNSPKKYERLLIDVLAGGLVGIIATAYIKISDIQTPLNDFEVVLIGMGLGLITSLLLNKYGPGI